MKNINLSSKLILKWNCKVEDGTLINWYREIQKHLVNTITL